MLQDEEGIAMYGSGQMRFIMSVRGLPAKWWASHGSYTKNQSGWLLKHAALTKQPPRVIIDDITRSE